MQNLRLEREVGSEWWERNQRPSKELWLYTPCSGEGSRIFGTRSRFAFTNKRALVPL